VSNELTVTAALGPTPESILILIFLLITLVFISSLYLSKTSEIVTVKFLENMVFIRKDITTFHVTK
jgi:hypothetical protein